jgi:hypothetical protein
MPVTPTDRTAGAAASVMYTDMGHITSFDDLPWRNNDEPDLTGLLDPGGPECVTVLNTRIGATRNISISFHDNVFDRSIIDRAADHLKNPIGLLG